MTKQGIRRSGPMTAAIVAVALAASAAVAGEPQTVKAFAVIEATGDVLPTGPDSTRVMGTLQGPFFIDAGHGPVDAGNLHCVANMQADVSSGRQTGEGSCVLTAHDGANLYGDWTCEGVLFIGCRGEFTITGGDGRLEGVTGGGAMTSRVSEFAVGSEDKTGIAKTASRGIVFWDEFVFATP
jgi:hypothetical protein